MPLFSFFFLLLLYSNYFSFLHSYGCVDLDLNLNAFLLPLSTVPERSPTVTCERFIFKTYRHTHDRCINKTPKGLQIEKYDVDHQLFICDFLLTEQKFRPSFVSECRWPLKKCADPNQCACVFQVENFYFSTIGGQSNESKRGPLFCFVSRFVMFFSSPNLLGVFSLLPSSQITSQIKMLKIPRDREKHVRTTQGGKKNSGPSSCVFFLNKNLPNFFFFWRRKVTFAQKDEGRPKQFIGMEKQRIC